ncbi:phenylacetate--CoA ligase family protein [Roseobacter weihaiensis]|uniref:hypothetical protein n=1 Tax=Roseobacter weihaiensis TaxID=2763262 RepID=UPI001D0B82D6|nr:hypothetical protein [Roseobacter sp. H9]
MQDFPLVTKEQLRLAGSRAQVRDGLVCTEVFTSGTTSSPFITIRGDREQEFVRRFYSQLYTSSFSKPLPRVVAFNNPFHGATIDVPSPVHKHRLGVYDSGSFEYARRIIESKTQDQGVEAHCSIVLGLERIIKAFALDTLDARPGGISTKLRSVVTFGNYLSRHCRSMIEKAMGAPVFDRYGLSEVFGGAAQITTCGWYHFDPSVIPEVVAPNSLEPVREGIGQLLLTSLFPFQEAQPFVRYVTGDIVEVTHSRSSIPGEIAIRPLGRERYAVPRPDGAGWIITAAEVFEAVDPCPGIVRTPLFRDSAQIRDPHRIGHPKYSLSYTDHEKRRDLTLQVEVVRKNTLMTGNMAHDLRNRVLAESAALSNWLEKGRGNFNVVFEANVHPDVISYRE